ncbi:MAG TPA: iron-sulfur cluster repair di-iron protein [Luteitalea sp.]|nr:iron-sulfur cluster repair di-iron protein [Luteitalea sp.]
MAITSDSLVADIATAAPGTIRVFQRHHIDFCCGGRTPLAEVCAERGLDATLLVTELNAAAGPVSAERSWQEAPLSELVAHIQERYHAHLREELPRLDAMVDKVVSRHGAHVPDVLLPLQATFKALQDELLSHMQKEDAVVFPAIVRLEAGDAAGATAVASLAAPIAVMEAEHESAGEALATMRALTVGYTPPEWACPTFRGLYFGLAQLESDMHVHVHLENHVLFPRAAQLAARH